ncbi:MAG: MarR family winged helix-turn-helix transcriptional regulator [Mycobacteriales bacterium]
MPTVTDTALASALRITVARLNRRLRSQRTGHDLTLTQSSALGALHRHGPLTLSELAAHEKVQPPSMTRVVNGLAERSLVTRTPHPTDGRQALLSVSEEGEALIRADRRKKEAWLARRLAELTPAERQILKQAAPILERLAGAE